MAPGEFENYTHEQLQAAVARSAPTNLTMQGVFLHNAGSVMTQIAEHLRRSAGRAEWKGEAGNAFREWSREFAREAEKLGTYSTKVGDVLSNAGQALSETKSGMPTAASDGVRREEAAASPGADLAREKQRQEAIAQLERLDSHYKVATENLTTLKEPNFRPMGPDFRPPGADHRLYPDGTAGPGGTPQLPQAGIQTEGKSSATGTPLAEPSAAPPTQDAASSRPSDAAVRTELDAATPVATEPRPPASGSTAPSTASPTPGASPSLTPALGPQRGQPPVTGGVPTRAPNPAPPNGNGPATSQQGRFAAPQTGTGIHGGTPVAPRQAGMPRGAVIDANTPPIRPAPGGVAAQTPGVVGPTGAAAPPRPGRPGSATSLPSTSQRPTAPRLSGSAFTPGGTGLVQGGATSGAVPPASSDSRQQRRHQGERPDYLKEDEQTWRRQVRNTAPPVID